MTDVLAVGRLNYLNSILKELRTLREYFNRFIKIEEERLRQNEER